MNGRKRLMIVVKRKRERRMYLVIVVELGGFRILYSDFGNITDFYNQEIYDIYENNNFFPLST